MSDHQDISTPASSTDASTEARRRLLRGALASGPVILSLSSRPVLATGSSGGGNCIAPSQTLSGAMSHATAQLGTCSGRSPGYWKTCSASSWPISQSTKFHSIFAIGTQAGTSFQKSDGTSKSMLEVLNLTTGDTEQMAFHIVGAYLNILAGLVDLKALTVPKLQAIWSEWASSLSYTPYAGAIPWNGTKIKQYLLSNYIVA